MGSEARVRNLASRVATQEMNLRSRGHFSQPPPFMYLLGRTRSFSRPILPEAPLRAEIQFEPEKDQIQFRYLHRETGEVLSSGRLKLERRP